jgi:hypothetical protein
MNKVLDILYGIIIIAITSVLFAFRTELRIKNFVTGGFLGAMASLRVLVYYCAAMWRDKQYREPPHDALFAKSLFDFFYGVFFVTQGLDDRLLARNVPSRHASHDEHGSLCTSYAAVLQFLFICGELCFVLAMIDLYKSLKNPFKSNSFGKRLKYYIRLMAVSLGVTCLMLLVPSHDIQGENPYSGAYGYTSRCFCGPRWQTVDYYKGMGHSSCNTKDATCYYKRLSEFCNVPEAKTDNGLLIWDSLLFYRTILWYLWIFAAMVLGFFIYLWAFDRLKGGVASTFETRMAIIKATNTNVWSHALFWAIWFIVYVILPAIPSITDSQYFPGA